MHPTRIALASLSVKLPGEDRGYSRYRSLAEILTAVGFEVTLITSTFQHWYKAQRIQTSFTGLPYRIAEVFEPGYKRNIDLRRLRSHHIAAVNICTYFRKHQFDLIVVETPPHDFALACTSAALKQGIPCIVDINDLWPEAMQARFDPPLLGRIGYAPIRRAAKRCFSQASAIVGTSDGYANYPERRYGIVKPHLTVYVGSEPPGPIGPSPLPKPPGELWISYAGTLGTSYDLETLIKAVCQLHCEPQSPQPQLQILGDGPDREKLQALTEELGAKAYVHFRGYMEYEQMMAVLRSSDILVNSLVKDAPQALVNKLSDYLFAGRALVNTGSDGELRSLISDYQVGLNVPAADVSALAEVLRTLCQDAALRKRFADNSRALAEARFDRQVEYPKIISLIEELLPTKG
ncbi:MAG: glycosyltransferase family 4 protein [Coriobacteriales bacterium]|jgi:glycosyltransferase involved in cell wall biosynthesis|nr:glycosyltransferase family 4 protein [Coriobacteriales bacterium]